MGEETVGAVGATVATSTRRVLGQGPLVVDADLPARAAGMLAEAVDRHRGALAALAARLTPAAGADVHRVRLDAGELAVVAQSARRAVAAQAGRYQPPAERARLEALVFALGLLDERQARLLLDGLAV